MKAGGDISDVHLLFFFAYRSLSAIIKEIVLHETRGSLQYENKVRKNPI